MAMGKNKSKSKLSGDNIVYKLANQKLYIIIAIVLAITLLGLLINVIISKNNDIDQTPVVSQPLIDEETKNDMTNQLNSDIKSIPVADTSVESLRKPSSEASNNQEGTTSNAH